VANPSPQQASLALAELDPMMAKMVGHHGPCVLEGRRKGRTRFEQLAEAIAYQQLAGKAAEAIWRRVRGVVDGPFTPSAVLAAGPEPFRSAGFSNAKTQSLLDLALRIDEGSVRLDRIGRLSDDEVVAHLVPVRGIGPWTAHMFLIFTLRRLDVWPVGDYGVRAGYASIYGLPELPTPQELLALGERFKPYRTIAAWYCWRAVTDGLW